MALKAVGSIVLVECTWTCRVLRHNSHHHRAFRPCRNLSSRPHPSRHICVAVATSTARLRPSTVRHHRHQRHHRRRRQPHLLISSSSSNKTEPRCVQTSLSTTSRRPCHKMIFERCSRASATSNHASSSETNLQVSPLFLHSSQHDRFVVHFPLLLHTWVYII